MIKLEYKYHVPVKCCVSEGKWFVIKCHKIRATITRHTTHTKINEQKKGSKSKSSGYAIA